SGPLRFLRSGNRLLIDDGVWDVATGKQVLDLRGTSEAVWGISFGTSEGHVLINNSIWSFQEGRRLKTFAGDSGFLGSSVRTARAARLVTTIEGTSVFVWDSESGKKVFTGKGHDKTIATVCLSSDGQL